MSYERLEQDIPLEDLDTEANYSDLLELFDEIENYTRKNRVSGEHADFTEDPGFQKQKELYFGGNALLRKLLITVCVAAVALWLVALIVYSNGKAQKATENMWHGSPTNIVALSDRNVTLNEYLPKLGNVSMAEYRKGTYFADEKVVRWLLKKQQPKEGSGVIRAGFYMTRDDKAFVIRQAETTFSKVVLETTQFEALNNFFYVDDLLLNPGVSVDDENTWHLLRSDHTPQWRHLSFSLYWLWNPLTGEHKPVGPNNKKLEKIHFATFSPDGKTVIFGHNHDLYLLDLSSMKTTRITTTGSPEIFNGKPDWVYEEEVYPHATMFWWSPDLKNLVYATINDTSVRDYKMDYYIKAADKIGMSYQNPPDETVDEINQYPLRTSIKYPKPGTPNPIISLSIYDATSGKTSSIDLNDKELGDDFVLYDAHWIDSNSLLVKVTDRTSTILKKKVYQVDAKQTKFVSKTNSTEYGGWIEKQQPITVIENESGNKYLDRVVDDMYVHLALFDLAVAEKPSNIISKIRLDSSVAYNAGEDEIYFLTESKMDHHFQAYSLKDGKTKTLTTDLGKYDILFNNDAQFVNLRYRGPHEPWQKLVNLVEWTENAQFVNKVDPVSDTQKLANTLSKVNVPTRVHSQIRVGHASEAAEVNMIEIFPPNFNPKKKHPLLVHVYGGPGSTTVTDDFAIDFQDLVSANLGAVVMIIDPRGTGSDDWKLKTWAYKQIGRWEPEDVIAITKDYILKNEYIDEKRTAVWGWSYGGFTTLKTLERDGGDVFKYGMAVAPVTNWMFYDSIYAERYMKSPKENEKYSQTAKINDFENFKDVSRFLVMSGTADDNVHFQNILWLLDNFNVKEVENYDMHIFPDSDHSIFYHNANHIVFDRLLDWLDMAFRGLWN